MIVNLLVILVLDLAQMTVLLAQMVYIFSQIIILAYLIVILDIMEIKLFKSALNATDPVLNAMGLYTLIV